MSFVSSVDRLRKRFCRGNPEAVRVYLEDDDRIAEAEKVSDLVARFSQAELQKKPLGRTIGATVIKPLGAQLGRTLKKADQETYGKVRDAIEATLAYTYASTMLIEHANDAHVVTDRTPEQIWEFWVPRIYTDYLRMASGLAQEDLDTFGPLGQRAIHENLDALSLGRKARKRRVNSIGISYGRAGAVLRLGQSSLTPDDWVKEPKGFQLASYWNAWPISDYPPGRHGK